MVVEIEVEVLWRRRQKGKKAIRHTTKQNKKTNHRKELLG